MAPKQTGEGIAKVDRVVKEDMLRQWHVPTSFQYIALPTQSMEEVKIVWQEDRVTLRATYYKCRGYWGDLNCSKQDMPTLQTFAEGPIPVSAIGDFVHVRGTADVFIAEEYILPEYCAARPNTIISAISSVATRWPTRRWITMQLNDCFHYGHRTSETKPIRFIVYHPPVANGIKPPNMFQHRFTNWIPNVGGMAKELADAAPEENGAKVAAKTGSLILQALMDIGKSAFGNSLHAFLPSKLGDLVDVEAQKMAFKQIDLGLNVSRVITAQALERHFIDADAKASKEESTARVKQGVKAQTELKKQKKFLERAEHEMKQPQPNINAVVQNLQDGFAPPDPSTTGTRADELSTEPEPPTGDAAFLTGTTLTSVVSTNEWEKYYEELVGIMAREDTDRDKQAMERSIGFHNVNDKSAGGTKKVDARPPTTRNKNTGRQMQQNSADQKAKGSADEPRELSDLLDLTRATIEDSKRTLRKKTSEELTKER